MKKAKRFDCLEMKRRGAERIYEKTKDMTPEEKLAYWSQRDEEFRQRRLARQQLKSETNVWDAIAKILAEWDAGENEEDGDRDVALRTVKVEAAIAPDSKLTAEVPSDIPPGQYRVTLIIEEPRKPIVAGTAPNES